MHEIITKIYTEHGRKEHARIFDKKKTPKFLSPSEVDARYAEAKEDMDLDIPMRGGDLGGNTRR